MSAKITQFPRPRSFTTRERLIDALREEIFKDGRPYAVIAERSNVSKSTINNIASGKTRWPRDTTLFPLLATLKLRIRLESDKR